MERENEETAAGAFVVRADDAGRRLDRVLRKLLPRASLARIYAGMRRGEAVVEGRARRPEYRLHEGEEIRLSGSLALSRGPSGGSPPACLPGVEARDLVIHSSEHFVVFNKPRGIPVHGAESLATAAQGLLASATRPSLSFKPGPVHRLDRDTSGLVFFAVSLAGARVLSRLLRDRACEKTYLALLQGELREAERWVDALRRDQEERKTVADDEGAPSVTEAAPLVAASGLTLARVRIESGRTHQIRAQAALHGHPLLGDGRYGGRADAAGYVLHAARFRLPEGNGISERCLFEAPLPASSLAALERHFGAARTADALSRLGPERVGEW